MTIVLYRERQRRTDLKACFAGLIEVVYGRDEVGQDIPLPVEAIHEASNIKILQEVYLQFCPVFSCQK